MAMRTTLLALLLIAAIAAYWIETSFLRTNIAHHTDIWKNYGAELAWDGKRPLNILFMSWGSRGDHQPNVAMALELAKLGHKVIVLGLEKYKHIIEQHEPAILYRPLYDDYIINLIDNQVPKGDDDGDDDPIKSITQYSFNSSEQLVNQYIDSALSTLPEEHGGGEIDVLFGSYAPPILLHHITVAETIKKPLFLLTHDPFLPSESYSVNPDEGRCVDNGRRANVLLSHIGSTLFGFMFTFGETPWRKLRRDLGVKTNFPFFRFTHHKYLVNFPIFDTSETNLWPRPNDWPSHWYATGFFEMPKDSKQEFDGGNELQLWIDERKEKFNRPLLFFGQGSFTSLDRVAMTQILIDTCERLQMDAVALATTIDFDGRPPPPFIKVVKEADLSSVFPQCSVIVHHGGGGTSSQVIRSGTPGVCMPFFLFQNNWGAQLRDIGAGTLVDTKEIRDAWNKNETNLLLDAVEEVMELDVQKAAAELGLKARESRAGGVQFAAKKTIEILQAYQNRVSNLKKDQSALKDDF